MLLEGDGDGPAGQVKVAEFRVLGRRFGWVEDRFGVSWLLNIT
ncbi:hypothetical protein [Candidatus Poriferisodalis sp.]